jgi:hypothetical protein
MRTQGHNLYQQLAGALPPDQLAALNKVLARPVLTLGAEDFQLDGQALSKALGDANGEHAGIPGLQLRVAALPEQHQQRSLAELGELLRDLQQQQVQLKEQLATAQALELVQRERDALEQQLVQLDAELRDYSQMQALQDSDAERQARLVTLDQKLAELATSLAQSAARYRALDQQRQQRQRDLESLGQQHRQIEQRRNQRIDQEGPFTWLSDSPHHPGWHSRSSRWTSWPNACRPIRPTAASCWNWTTRSADCWAKSTGGLTKYQFVGEPEAEIARLVEFAHHLPQEAEALEKKVRSAVVNVAACLRELRDGLAAFKRRMREFNRKISGRQLSDLAVFKIEPEDETALVEAIELLISTAATVGNGETFELFNQQTCWMMTSSTVRRRCSSRKATPAMVCAWPTCSACVSGWARRVASRKPSMTSTAPPRTARC